MRQKLAFNVSQCSAQFIELLLRGNAGTG